MPFIYKITSPSGKVYVGSTVNAKQRYSQYKNLHCKEQRKLYNSFLKYGFNNHLFQVIAECELDCMLKLEAMYGQIFDVLGVKGLNLSLPKGSDTYRTITEENRIKRRNIQLNKPVSEESKMKISNKLKGNKHWLGKKHKEETKIKMSDWQKGRKLSKSHCDNIKKAKQNISIESRIKMSNAQLGGKSINAKKVMCNITGKKWDCIKDAAIELGINISTLRNKLNGCRKNNTSLIHC